MKALVSLCFAVACFAQNSVTLPVQSVAKTCPAGQAFTAVTAQGALLCNPIAGAGTASAPVDTSMLNTLYPQLAVSNTYAAGAKQLFAPNPVSAGIRIVAGPIPQLLYPGDLFLTPGGLLAWFDGSVTRFAGGGGSPPASSSTPCFAGQMTSDQNYVYACISANRWKRAPLSAF